MSGTPANHQINICGSGKYHIGMSGVTCGRWKVRTRNKSADAVNIYGPSSGTITDLFVLMGKVNIESAIITKLWVDWLQNPSSDASIAIAAGAAVAFLEQSAGYVVNNDTGGIATVHMHGGVCQFNYGLITALKIQNATLIYNSSGGGANATIANAQIFARGLLDFTKSGDARIVTASYITAGGEINVTGVANSVTFTAAPIVSGNSVGVRGSNVAFTQIN